MKKTYKGLNTRSVLLPADELLQIQGASTNLEDTGFGGGTEGNDGIEADTKQTGMWSWTNNDL